MNLWPWSKKAETVTYEYKPIPVVLNRIPVRATIPVGGNRYSIPASVPRKDYIRAVLVLIGIGTERTVHLSGQTFSHEIGIEWAREYYPALFKEPKGGWKVFERGIMSGGSKR